MQKTGLLLLLHVLYLHVFAQPYADRNRFKGKVDTVLVFQPGVRIYDLVLEGKKQAFFWGSVDDSMGLNNVYFRIRNTTSEIIAIQRIDAGDGAILFQPLRRQEALLPDSCMLIRSLFVRRNGSGLFSKPIMVFYQRGKTRLESIIPTWGTFPPLPTAGMERRVSDSPAIRSTVPIPPVPVSAAPSPTSENLSSPEKEFYLSVLRDNKPIGATCVLELRGKRLQPVADTNGMWLFRFWARPDEVLDVRIISKAFGTMQTRLYCFRGPWLYEEFLLPGESYFYDGRSRNRYIADSGYYQIVARRETPVSFLIFNDSVDAVIQRSGIRPLRKNYAYIQFNSQQDAVALEQKLLQSWLKAYLEPRVKLDRGEINHLGNGCRIVFRDHVQESWVQETFQKIGVINYYRHASTAYDQNVYWISFVHGADRGYLKILDRLWAMPEVSKITQDVLTIYQEDRH